MVHMKPFSRLNVWYLGLIKTNILTLLKKITSCWIIQYLTVNVRFKIFRYHCEFPFGISLLPFMGGRETRQNVAKKKKE